MAGAATTATRTGEEFIDDAHSVEDLPALALIRLAMQRHTAMFTSHMIGELTQTQFATMARLLETGPCSQNHLGRLVFLDAATINGVVGRLKRRGLVATGNDPDDIRLSILSLSRKGRRLIGSAIAVASRVNEDTLRSLTAAERHQLTGLLRKLGYPPAAMETHEPETVSSGGGRLAGDAGVRTRGRKAQTKEDPASGDGARRVKSLRNAKARNA